MVQIITGDREPPRRITAQLSRHVIASPIRAFASRIRSGWRCP